LKSENPSKTAERHQYRQKKAGIETLLLRPWCTNRLERTKFNHFQKLLRDP